MLPSNYLVDAKVILYMGLNLVLKLTGYTQIAHSSNRLLDQNEISSKDRGKEAGDFRGSP